MSEEQENVGKDFSTAIQEMLDKLDPSTEVEITDITGKSTKLNAFVSARKQIRIFKRFKDMSKKEIFVDKIARDSTIVEQIIDLASDEEVAEELGEIFKLAYPDLYNDPLDELPLEELIGAILPFCLRFLKKVGMGLTKVIPQT